MSWTPISVYDELCILISSLIALTLPLILLTLAVFLLAENAKEKEDVANMEGELCR